MIFITGDTHGDIDINKLKQKHFNDNSLTKNDYVIITGDFGLIWNMDKKDKWWLEWLENKNFTTLFVDGNHENHNMLDSISVEIWNGGKVHKINNSIIHLMRGQVFIINDIKLFTFGGGESIDKLHRIEGVSWWRREMPSYQEFEEGFNNLDKHNWKVDYVVTHECSEKILIEFCNHMNKYDKRPTVLSKYFNTLEEKLDYKHWFCGHYHVDEVWDGKHTFMYQNIIELKEV